MKCPAGLKWLHLTAGVLGIVAFLGTGQFMHHRLDHLAGMPDAPRALYRSAHIYILFAALLNLGIGAYVTAARAIVPRAIQYVGSALLVAALLSFLYGFFVETPLGLVERPTMRTGINWALWGVLLHTAAGLVMPIREHLFRTAPDRPAPLPSPLLRAAPGENARQQADEVGAGGHSI